MTRPGALRPTLRQALAVLGAAVVLGGVALVYFGVGADVSGDLTVTIVARAVEVKPAVAEAVQEGDVIYNDIGGAVVGTVVGVTVRPEPRVTADASGTLGVSGDPTLKQVDLTIRGTGRIGDGLVILQSQVVQVGRGIVVTSKRYSFDPNPTVISIDVR